MAVFRKIAKIIYKVKNPRIHPYIIFVILAQNQGCKMDCENCDNCEIAILKKHNFANNTIQFFECRSQSQHNTI